MLWGIIGIVLIIILIIYIVYIKQYQNDSNSINSINVSHPTIIENFLLLDDSKLRNDSNNSNNSNNSSTNDINKPVDIQYQLPIPANQLSDIQLQAIDSDILRNTRSLKNFSMTDEFDFYQMYNILKQLKNNTIPYTFKYNPLDIKDKSTLLSGEKIIVLNSGAINNKDLDLELFSRMKLELISAFNNLIIKNDFFIPYHPYQFFKIINSNMISSDVKAGSTLSKNNYVFTLTIAREYKYQQFTIYYDIDLQFDNSNNYTMTLNKVELIGIPIPKTIEFHENKKTTSDSSTGESGSGSGSDNVNNVSDAYYKDQVSDSASFDVVPIGDYSTRFKSPDIKYIDITEKNDMDRTMFDQSSLSTKMEDRIMNVSRDQQFNNHKCFGLVNGISQNLPEYNNPIFCKSFHPSINQNGIWDAPCQVNSDCPFYKANKNYSNEFGKCDKVTGQCELPLGVIPIGFTKFGKNEPNCYNCGVNSEDSKCCSEQSDAIKSGIVNYSSPDYVFKDDETYRRQFADDLKSVGLLINPSI